MKILLASHFFYPAIGGLETVGRILSEQLVARGHEVRVLTTSLARTPADDEGFPFSIYRQPPARQLVELVRWCDLYFQNNISLRTLWPLLMVNRPWIFSHQTWLTRVDGSIGWQDRLKLFVVRFATYPPIAISQAVAEPLPVRAAIIGNPYADDLFRVLPDVKRDRDIVFLSRLVSDKGGDLTLEALSMLKAEGIKPSLTIVGAGPEADTLRRMTVELGLQDQVTFAGMITGEPLVEMLNRHRIMVVPSRLAEPFGVVALEGIACGCALVGSERGGLADAIGPCGLTFPNNDAPALAKALRRLYEDDALCQSLRAQAPAHLQKHTAASVVDAYLTVFEHAVAQKKAKR